MAAQTFAINFTLRSEPCTTARSLRTLSQADLPAYSIWLIYIKIFRKIVSVIIQFLGDFASKNHPDDYPNDYNQVKHIIKGI